MFRIQNFRDVLTLAAFLVVIPALWVGQGVKLLSLPGEVVGATIAVWTLMAQFYYRKAMDTEVSPTPVSTPSPKASPGP